MDLDLHLKSFSFLLGNDFIDPIPIERPEVRVIEACCQAPRTDMECQAICNHTPNRRRGWAVANWSYRDNLVNKGLIVLVEESGEPARFKATRRGLENQCR